MSESAERAVLGAMLKCPACVPDVRAALAWQDFTHHAHQMVCRAVFEAADEGAAIDPVAVGERLIGGGRLEPPGSLVGLTAAGVVSLMAELPDACPSVTAAAEYAAGVKRESDRRALHRRIDRLAGLAADPRLPLEDLQSELARTQAETPAPPPAEDRPILTLMSDVRAERITWLWHGWLPDGCLCVLDGDPGLGKSSLTLDLAARLSRGDALPPLSGRDLGRGPCATLLLGAEDSLKHTVRPRLDAMGADCSRVHALEGFLSSDGKERLTVLPRDLERVESFIVGNGVRLVVVDPLMAFLSSETDAHRDQDVRRCLRPLAHLADRLGVVVLLVRHLNKLSGGPALYRGGSSIGITGASRASLIVGRDPMTDRFVLAMNKINVGPKPASLAYRLEGAGLASRVAWDDEACDLRPDQILGHGQAGAPPRGPGRPPSAVEVAREFLRQALAGGPVATAEVMRRAKDVCIADATLKRARADLGVVCRKEGANYVMELPPGGGGSKFSLGDNIDPPPPDDDDNPFD